jgi:recombination associated protein RdgC
VFKNLSLYRIGPDWAPTLQTLESALDPQRFVPCSASQEKSIGWVEPRGIDHGPLAESVQGQWLLKLRIESKSVPGNVVRQALDDRVAQIEAATGRKPGKKEKRQLKDEIVLALLPQAFARQTSVMVWIDLQQRRLMLDTTSQGKADEAISSLLKALPGLQLSPVQTQTSPQAAMTEWLLAASPDDWPAALCVERECTLKSTGEDAASIRYVRHPLANDDVRKHVTEGKLPTQLALSWDGRVAFVLTETLQLRKVQFLDGVMDAGDADKGEDRFDADVTLSTGLLSPLLDSLIEALGGELQWGTPAAADDPPF